MTKADTITSAERKSIRTPLGYQRLYLNLTRRQLSELSGVSVRTIRDYETGKKDMGNMGFETAYALFNALRISMDVIRFE
jgi:transcriptional regulator with XRE-family HTH domain